MVCLCGMANGLDIENMHEIELHTYRRVYVQNQS